MSNFLRRSPSGEAEGADPVLEELLIAGSLEPNEDPRAIAAAVLSKFEIIQNRAKKIRLLQAAARAGAAWSAPFLIELLADPTEEIRDAAVRELIARPDCPFESLCQRLTRPPWYSKSAALRVLAARRPDGSAKAVRVVIEDSNADVRRYAALALGEIGGAEARALLVRLSKDESPHVRSAAVSALDKICDFKFT